MASTLKHDTWLWSDDAPLGRIFPAGSDHPGKGWRDEPPTVSGDLILHTGHVSQSANEASAAEWGDKLSAAMADLTAKHDEAKAALSAENDDLRGQIASLTEDLRQAKEKIDGQDEELSSRAGVIFELRDQVAQQAALIAKFDPDGDGKPGGRARKAT